MQEASARESGSVFFFFFFSISFLSKSVKCSPPYSDVVEAASARLNLAPHHVVNGRSKKEEAKVIVCVGCFFCCY